MSATLLLIEDEDDIAELLAVRLRAAGYLVHIATDAMTGVQSAHKLKPDLILLDLKMPAGGGLGVIKNLRNSVNTKLIPLIVVTGTADAAAKSRLLEFGIKTYIQKPYKPEDLLQAIAQALPAKLP